MTSRSSSHGLKMGHSEGCGGLTHWNIGRHCGSRRWDRTLGYSNGFPEVSSSNLMLTGFRARVIHLRISSTTSVSIPLAEVYA
jgi:hypothetical protein